MPKRPKQHVTGDRAVQQISATCGACGWACDGVVKDYGEDIIVQTTLNGRLDPFRVFIQAKGTENLETFRTKKHGYSYSFSADLFTKWLRSREAVIVVLWDVTKKRGLWAQPNSTYHQLSSLDRSPGSVRLSFPTENHFNKRQAVKLVWQIRLVHFNSLLAEIDSLEKNQKERSSASSRLDEKRFEIGLDFLLHAGIIIREAGSENLITSDKLRQIVSRSQKALLKKAENTEILSFIHQSAILAFVTAVYEMSSGCWVPTNLCHVCGSIIARMILLIGTQGIAESSGAEHVLKLVEEKARLALDEGQNERAARLFGASQKLAKLSRLKRSPNERKASIELGRKICATLGNDAFGAWCAVGRTMEITQLLEYALN